MYKSRLHFENSTVSVAFDSVTGEILEIIDKRTGDNIIKSNTWNTPGTFILYTPDGKRVSVPAYSKIRENPLLGAVISAEYTDGGDVTVKVAYGAFDEVDGSLTYTVALRGEDGEIDFALETDICAVKCEFPVINGVWLGERYDDDTLVYPFNAGIKLENPVVSMSQQPQRVFWRWQEYRYVYNLKGMGLAADGDGFYSLSSLYSGPLSMAYCDLYDADSGVMLCCPKEQGIVCVTARTRGIAEPGMSMCIGFSVPKGEKCRRMEAVMLLHGGSWRYGADFYRRVRGVACEKKDSTFASGSGLAAHYDFKYQNGGVVHRYCDIPMLADRARSMGLDHLLISGWHKDGFDNGFPQYWADDELGTVAELTEGLRIAHEKGVKVSFYINSRLANLKYEISDVLSPAASRTSDGKVRTEKYGDASLEFAIMCAGAEMWQNHLKKAFEYVRSVGADGIYLDQIGMAPPCECYDTSHGHSPDAWVAGCRKILSGAKELGLNLIIEGCSDLYGDIVDGQLVSTFSYIDCAFPEMYSYTYPEQTLVDMVYPKRNIAMRPVFVGNNSRRMNDTAFLCGMYFWAYDLEDDNTFTRDPESLEYLEKTLALRGYFRSDCPGARYRENQGVISDMKTAFYTRDGGAALCFSGEGRAVIDGVYEVERVETLAGCEARWSTHGGKTEIEIDGDTLGYAVLVPAKDEDTEE